MDAIDKLLNELKAEYEQSQAKSVVPQQSQTKPSIPSASSGDRIARLLSEVKADFEQQDLAQELQRQQELEQERIKQAQLKAKQLAALQKQAQDWLEKLDPFSPEGLWFERFAEKYSSKLEAAVDYLHSK
ncbi:MAG: hypothetical protein QNJ51_27030 [Calothrix sp. MO_167.B12]|nr:hypothetical protein [Calothrix sp. MO_167.B12]